MDLAKTRILTDNVAGLASFYAALVGVDVVTNDYYVEVKTPTAVVAFSRRQFIELNASGAPLSSMPSDTVILDFLVDDVDRHYERVNRLGVAWINAPTTQPWGNRSMMFRDPDGNLVNLFSFGAGLM